MRTKATNYAIINTQLKGGGDMGTAVQPNQRVEKRHGKLTIFTSYFSGAGKSYRMLETAKRVKRAGVDVAVGVVSCDQWPPDKGAGRRA